MTKKQKKMLIRILITFVLFAILFVCEHTGILAPLEGTFLLFLIYLVMVHLKYTHNSHHVAFSDRSHCRTRLVRASSFRSSTRRCI